MGDGDRPVGEGAGQRARGAAQPGAPRRPAHGDSRPAALPVEAWTSWARGSPTGSPATRTRRTGATVSCSPNCSVLRWLSTARSPVSPAACTPGLMLSRALHLTRLQVQAPSGPVDRQLGSALVRRARSHAARTGNRAPRSRAHRALGGVPARHSAEPGGAHRLDCLLALLTDDVSAARSLGPRGVDPDRDVGADKDSPKSESRLWQPRSLVSPKPPRSVRPDPRTRFSRKRRSSYESQYR
jgi:hypothetical protein